MTTTNDQIKTMTLQEFWEDVHLAHKKNPDWRLGQTAFNQLAYHRPELVEQVRATENDPFFAREMTNWRFLNFAEFLAKNWNPEE